MKIILASHNEHKVREINNLVRNFDITFKSLKDINWTEEIEENGLTIEENAWIKAEAVWSALGVPVLAEDTGLLIEALNGAPGVHTARYAGDEKNDRKNMQKVLDQLGHSDKRKAKFITVMALIMNDQRRQFTGVCEGKIGYIKSGSGGFGYDPIFIPEGYNRSFGQLSQKVKNEMSHRSKAIDKVLRFLENRD